MTISFLVGIILHPVCLLTDEWRLQLCPVKMEELLENETEILVSLLENHSVVLEKSSTPIQKSRKAAAMAELCASLSQSLGRAFDAEKVKKKIANL